MKNIFTFILLSFTIFASAADIPTVSQQQLLSMQSAKPQKAFLLLDVRSSEEYAEGHISGAIDVSHNNVKEKLSMLSEYKDKTVVVYCRSGRRAGIAENILVNSGFTQVKHLTGDMNGWLAADLPTANK